MPRPAAAQCYSNDRRSQRGVPRAAPRSGGTAGHRPGGPAGSAPVAGRTAGGRRRGRHARVLGGRGRRGARRRRGHRQKPMRTGPVPAGRAAALSCSGMTRRHTVLCAPSVAEHRDRSGRTCARPRRAAGPTAHRAAGRPRRRAAGGDRTGDGSPTGCWRTGAQHSTERAVHDGRLDRLPARASMTRHPAFVHLGVVTGTPTPTLLVDTCVGAMAGRETNAERLE